MKKKANYEEKVQKIGIKNFYCQRLQARVDRFQKWGMRHRRRRELIYSGMIENPTMVVGIFCWEIEKSKDGLRDMEVSGIKVEKGKKSPKKTTHSLITKASQKQKRAGDLKPINSRGRHLKLC